MKVGPRIYVIVALMVIGTLAIIGIAQVGMSDIRATYDRAFTSRAPIARVIDEFRSTVPDTKLQVWSLLVPDMPAEFVNQQLTDMSALKQSFVDYEADWANNAAPAASAEEKAAFDTLKTATDEMWVAIDEYNIHMWIWAKTGNTAERAIGFASNNTSGAVDVTTTAVEDALVGLVEANAAENKKAVSEAAAEQSAALMRLGLAGAAVILIGLIAAVLIANSITKPLKQAVAFADSVAGGDLDARIEKHSGAEVGELTRAVQQMKESLVMRVNQMHEVAATVELAAEGVSSTATDVMNEARAAGNESLAAKGEKLASQAGNLVKALSGLK
jgi:methyl-accepting chemotaxis protein